MTRTKDSLLEGHKRLNQCFYESPPSVERTPERSSESYIQSLRTESRMSFDPQPILKGELLGLRSLRPEDFNDLYTVASDPLIWEQHPIKDRYKEEVFRRFFREALVSVGALIAIDSEDSQIIGSS
jgi:hypothetical protein